VIADLEIWLMGTPDQLTAAMTALAAAGRIAAASPPERLYGTDSGRARRYLRIAVPTPAHPATTPPGEGQQAIDLAGRSAA
jgi:hypothetical protein